MVMFSATEWQIESLRNKVSVFVVTGVLLSTKEQNKRTATALLLKKTVTSVTSHNN